MWEVGQGPSGLQPVAQSEQDEQEYPSGRQTRRAQEVVQVGQEGPSGLQA